MDPITLAAIIGGGGSLLSSIFGNAGKKKRTQRNAGQIKELADSLFNTTRGKSSKEFQNMSDLLGDLSDLGDEYRTEGMKSYIDTTEGKALTSKIDEQTQSQKNRLKEDSNMLDLTDEAYLAGLGKINKGQSDAVAGLAGRSDMYRQNARSNRQNILGQLFGANQSLAGMKTGMYNSAVGNAGSIYGKSMAEQNQAMNNVNSGFQNAGMLASLLR